MNKELVSCIKTLINIYGVEGAMMAINAALEEDIKTIDELSSVLEDEIYYTNK